eukprot:gnl/TRDRNA2_/TRDRNA2_164489_c3_seq1.p1 gnl/TRDRNA2_/TRDRNA2_164489_c3~~gnl/TRDRNA2_/TRDRNA2_164489_c3_seq1.p1  ORF type:complete len:143 (-),score=10.40 gnl/TRDRNA2_/TRDRNA2_164489_c3_seq1:123-503(-)
MTRAKFNMLTGTEVQLGDLRPGLPALWSETAYAMVSIISSLPAGVGDYLSVASGFEIVADGADFRPKDTESDVLGGGSMITSPAVDLLGVFFGAAYQAYGRLCGVFTIVASVVARCRRGRRRGGWW